MSSKQNMETQTVETLASVLPWEWILETLLDSREFPLSCLTDIMEHIPRLQDPQCAELFQKVVLRYLEEIVLSRKLNPSAVILLKYLLEPQGDSNLNSRKESVENDLILRVETELVLATVREKEKDGTRNWEAFAHLLEEVFPESAPETCKLERRNELLTLSSVSECQGFQELMNKYLEDLLKDLLQFIECRKRRRKTKFLDQLASHVMSGSNTPSVFGPHEEAVTTSEPVTKERYGRAEVIEKLSQGDKALLRSPRQTEYALPKILLGEPIENFRTVKPSPEVRTKRGCPISSSSPGYAGRSAMPPVEQLQRRNLGANKTAEGYISADKDSGEDFEMDMSPSMMEIDEELRSHANELIDDLGKMAADIHKVAVNSSEEAFTLVGTVCARDQQKLDPVPFLENLDIPMKLPAVERVVGSAKKLKRGSSGDNSAREARTDGGAELSDKKENDSSGLSRGDRDRNPGPSCSISGDYLNSETGRARYRRIQVVFKECTERLFTKSGEPTLQLTNKRGSSADDTRCGLCQRGGVSLRCHGCSVGVHERCLEELGMRRSKDEIGWFCPSCVKQLTSQIKDKVLAVVDKAEQEAAAFLHATSKQSGERHLSAETSDRSGQMIGSTGAVLEPKHNADESTPAPIPDVQPSVMNVLKVSQIRELKNLEAELAPPETNLGDTRYSLRPRVRVNSKETGLTLLDEEDSAGLEHGAAIREGEPAPKPSATASRDTPNKSMPKMVTEDIRQPVYAPEEIPKIDSPLNILSNERRASRAGNCSLGGEERANQKTRSSKQDPSNSGVVNLSEVSHARMDDANDHSEEETDKNQVDVVTSEAEQTHDHASPDYRRTAPRKGRHRDRWNIPGVRRKNLPWSEDEVAVLREGVRKYSYGDWGFRWKSILEFGNGKFDPSRTAIDLKDKWRNLNKRQDRSPSPDTAC